MAKRNKSQIETLGDSFEPGSAMTDPVVMLITIMGVGTTQKISISRLLAEDLKFELIQRRTQADVDRVIILSLCDAISALVGAWEANRNLDAPARDIQNPIENAARIATAAREAITNGSK